MPAFLVEGQIQRVFAEDLTTLDPALGTAETQFRAGLDKFGLIEVMYATGGRGRVLEICMRGGGGGGSGVFNILGFLDQGICHVFF